jgi:hypothetical protein
MADPFPTEPARIRAGIRRYDRDRQLAARHLDDPEQLVVRVKRREG